MVKGPTAKEKRRFSHLIRRLLILTGLSYIYRTISHCHGRNSRPWVWRARGKKTFRTFLQLPLRLILTGCKKRADEYSEIDFALLKCSFTDLTMRFRAVLSTRRYYSSSFVRSCGPLTLSDSVTHLQPFRSTMRCDAQLIPIYIGFD